LSLYFSDPKNRERIFKLFFQKFELIPDKEFETMTEAEIRQENTIINVAIYLDADLANLGREMGLNLSKVCENALKSVMSRLQRLNVESNDKQQIVSVQSSDEWNGQGSHKFDLQFELLIHNH
jgi:post-segregation antitoxin (ccd killing protein)